MNASGIEINPKAADLAEAAGYKVYRCSILDWQVDYTRDLSFTKGVLIHIDPASLPKVYDRLYEASSKYVLIGEYYNPSPVEVSYRGHSGKLFKRDFAGEFLARHPDMRLVDYGFHYRGDALPQDDITWFLMQRR